MAIIRTYFTKKRMFILIGVEIIVKSGGWLEDNNLKIKYKKY